MADPAIEAAAKVWATRKNIPFAAESPWARDSLIPTAREALKPVRELHTPYTVSEPDGEWSFCAHSHNSWPCETAKLIYTTEELAQ